MLDCYISMRLIRLVRFVVKHSPQTQSDSKRPIRIDPSSYLDIMKDLLTLVVAGASLFTVTNAYVVHLYGSGDCTGDYTERNVWDNTCAYTDGFSSLRFVTNGGGLQQLTAYSRQACAGTTTFQACAAGVNSIAIGSCHGTFNKDGASNALSSYSSGGACPN